MNRFPLIFCIVCVLIMSACDPQLTTRRINLPEATPIALVPSPIEIKMEGDYLLLSQQSEASCEENLKPFLHAFAADVHRLTDVNLNFSEEIHEETALHLSLSASLSPAAFEIHIDRSVGVKAGSPQAVGMALQSLLQIVEVHEGALAFPRMELKDQPAAGYRGLMIDLARQWHDLKTLKKLVQLAAFYKSNYLHLHFTDYQSYTLPSKHYPKLSTPDRHYTQAELQELDEFARKRGLTIIPEIDIPGHASSIVKAYPEIFAIKDMDKNPWIINMGSERVYRVLDTLLMEVAETFPHSPYLHIGGDEAIFDYVMADPQVKNYLSAHDLEADVHELYRHFLVRMNEIVKKHGRQMCVWEGFRPEGKVKIPQDILVFEFETNRYLPQDLVRDGYQVVNTSWKPLYVVNQKKWSPATIYDWHPGIWANWWEKAPSFSPIQVTPTPLIIGGQMCAWEQPADAEIPSLRKRLPVMNERLWQLAKSVSLEDLLTKLEQTDHRLSQLIGDGRQDSLLIGYDFEAAMLEE
ncbi:MAG: family 20 glycosylhydrolase [Bacteroidota bacterium]